MNKIQRKLNDRRKKKFEKYWRVVLERYNLLEFYTKQELKNFVKDLIK